MYILDILIAAAFPVAIYALTARGILARSFRRLYWLGVCIGLTWEVTFFFLGPEFSVAPLFIFFSRSPLPPWLLPLFHSLWDGGLFIVGLLLIRLLPGPHLARFRWDELLVMLAWGQAQELCVELSATAAGLWTYLPHPWNPVLFPFGQGQITLLPQLVWLVAPLVFYPLALRIHKG